MCFASAMAAAALLTACSIADDYMLGKDNTPRPKALQDVQSKVTFDALWSASTGRANKSAAYLKLKPVIDGQYVYVASTNGTIQAINKKTGQVAWSTVLSSGINSGPSLKQGVLAVGTNASSVVLLQQRDGHKLWEANVSSDVLSKPLIHDHRVLVKTIDGNLFALDQHSGTKQWVSEHGAPSLILKASASPVMMDNLILVGFSDGKLDAIDSQTGHQVWQRSIAYANGSSDVERLVDIDADPKVSGDVVYLASYQGYIGALSVATGQFVWNKPASIYKNLAMDDTTLYATDSHDVLWAFNRQDGQVKWKQVSLKARGLTEPVFLGRYLLVGDKTGLLHVVSRHDGALIGRYTLNGGVDIAPAVAGEDVYVMTTNGQLHHLKVKHA